VQEPKKEAARRTEIFEFSRVLSISSFEARRGDYGIVISKQIKAIFGIKTLVHNGGVCDSRGEGNKEKKI